MAENSSRPVVVFCPPATERPGKGKQMGKESYSSVQKQAKRCIGDTTTIQANLETIPESGLTSGLFEGKRNLASEWSSK